MPAQPNHSLFLFCPRPHLPDFFKVIVNSCGMLLFKNEVSYLSVFANCITNKLNLIHALIDIVEVTSSSFVLVVKGQLSW
jgi:hypothetical protein